jgi:hypothetical protein
VTAVGSHDKEEGALFLEEEKKKILLISNF